MHFSLSILLYAYILLVAIFIIFAVIHILHLVYLTVTNHLSYFVTVIFLLGFIVIIGGSYTILSTIDWNQGMTESIPAPNSAQQLFQ